MSQTSHEQTPKVTQESGPTGASQFKDELSTEYYHLLEIVNEFDKRLLTVKGWGVTVSLLALAWGFQHQHYGLFLVAAISGLAFWLLEGVVKQHQMRYYVRMREIEVVSFELFSLQVSEQVQASTPQIDWSWEHAPEYFKGKPDKVGSPQPKRYMQKASYALTWLYPHVWLPHAIAVAAGGLLSILGVLGRLDMPL